MWDELGHGCEGLGTEGVGEQAHLLRTAHHHPVGGRVLWPVSRPEGGWVSDNPISQGQASEEPALPTL